MNKCVLTIVVFFLLGVGTLFTGSISSKAKPIEGALYPPRLRDHEVPKPPWPRRRIMRSKPYSPKGKGLTDLTRWPKEPDAPSPLDKMRFSDAVKELCSGWMPPFKVQQYAQAILKYSQEFDLDPFLMAALIYRQSRCLPNVRDPHRIGLAGINLEMHAGFFRRRSYHYFVLDGRQWKKQSVVLDRFPFSAASLHHVEPNIYFAAGLLSIFKRQCPAIDGVFGSVPHRHFVSHFIYGDRVEGAGAEDRVFCARRRMIEYYSRETPQPKAKFKSLPLLCPLDGEPRVVTSGMGSDRDNGRRKHKGIDFGSTHGEPVRAVADGVVVVAGIDGPHGGPINLTPQAAAKKKRNQMGPGGLIVMIKHAEDLTSAYMHLFRYIVKAGQHVKGGELIGTVGRSGVKESGPHLHFELRLDGKHIDPMPYLKPYVFPPEATYLGRRLIAEENRLRRRRRMARYRERKAAREADRAAQQAASARRKAGADAGKMNLPEAGQTSGGAGQTSGK